ncbi:hypothetical protein AAVH_18319 [Aphelenchoides avenae]|nr:hypothetical protein AAVH_18319 [Aphelenchus avenae]
MLPNESLLQVLHFADYKTLALVKLSGAGFLRFITKYEEELARRPSYRVTFHTACISYSDVTISERPKRIRYEPTNRQSIAGACRKLERAIGPHGVANLTFTGRTLNMYDVDAVFQAVPLLKYAEYADLYWPDSSTGGSTNPEAFLENFTGMKTLRLSLDFNTFRKLSWSFLRKECARKLRLIKVSGSKPPTAGSMNASVKELVRYCVSLLHLQDGEPLELDFSNNSFSGAFGVRIIELLRGTAREVTFRMWARHDDAELIRNAVGARSDYSVGAGNYMTRYASDISGILVKAKGPWEDRDWIRAW